MSCNGKLDKLLYEFGILLIPRVKETELTIGIVRLNALNTSELGCGMPDQFVGDGDVSIRLVFA